MSRWRLTSSYWCEKAAFAAVIVTLALLSAPLDAHGDSTADRCRAFDEAKPTTGIQACTDWLAVTELSGRDRQEALLTRAKAYRLDGKLEKALADLSEAAKIDADNLILLLESGRVHAALKQWANAITDYDRLISIAGPSDLAYLERGQANEELKKTEEALKDYAEAVRLGGASKAAGMALWRSGQIQQNLGRHAEAVAALSGAIKAFPSEWTLHWLRAQSYLALGQPEQARAEADLAIGLDPNKDQAWAMRAMARKELGDLPGAIKDWEKAAALNPAFGAHFSNQAKVYSQLKQYDKAVVMFGKAIRLKPDDPQTLWLRADALVNLDRFVEAIADLDRAIAMKPDFAPPYALRGAARYRQKDYKAALVDLNKAIALDARSTSSFHTRAKTYEALGDLSKALADYETAVRLAPGHANLAYQYGRALIKAKQPSKAVDAFTAAIKAEPDAALFFEERALAYEDLGRLSEAIDDYGGAIRLHAQGEKKRAAFGYQSRATLRMMLGELDAARADFEQALALDPGFAAARKNKRSFDEFVDVGGGKPLNREAFALVRDAQRSAAANDTAQAVALLESAIKKGAGHAYPLFELATVYRNEKDWQRALAAIERARKINPRSAVILGWRGSILRRLDRLDEARADLARAVEGVPGDHVLLGEYGIVLHKAGQNAAAIDVLTKAIAISPDDHYHHYWRAQAYRDQKEFAKSLKDLDRVVALMPNEPLYRRTRANVLESLGRIDDAIREWGIVVDLEKGEQPAWRAGAFILRGHLFYREGDLKRAQDDFETVFTLDPSQDFVEPLLKNIRLARHRGGDELSKQGRQMWGAAQKLRDDKMPEAALKAFQALAAVEPRNPLPQIYIALVYSVLKQPDHAIAALSKAIALNGRDAVSFNDRGVYYLELRQTDAALRDFNKAIEIDPLYALAWRNRGRLFKDAGKLDAALRDLDKSVALKADAENLFHRSQVLTKLGRAKEGLADIDQALALDPDYAEAFYVRALAEWALSKPDAAFLDLEKSVKLLKDPEKKASAYLQGGDWRQERKEFREAVSQYTQALQMKPDWPKALHPRGVALGLLGDLADAIRDFAKLVELEPQVKAHKQNLAMSYRKLATVKYRAKDIDGVFAAISKAIALVPDNGSYLLDRAEFYGLHKRFGEAIPDYERVIKLGGGDARIFYDLGYARYMTKDFAGALADFETAFQLNPKNVNAKTAAQVARRELAKARQTPGGAQPGAQATGQSKSSDNVRSARAAPGAAESDKRPQDQAQTQPQAATTPDEQIRALTAQIEGGRETVALLLERGSLLAGKSSFELAMRDAEVARRKEPNNARVHELRAQINFRKRNLDAALSDANRAIELDARSYFAHLLRANIHAAMAHFDKAIVDLDRALKINPGDRTAAVLRKQMDAMAKSRAR